MDKIKKLFEHSDNVWVIHYASSDFTKYPIRIASIVLRKLTNNQTYSFSMNDKEYDENKEKQILKDFFEHIKLNPRAKYLTWNMRGSIYGFKTIENRFIDLYPNEELPYVVADVNKSDLSHILSEMYGDNYIDHDRLENLIKINSLFNIHFIRGKDEAKEFENQQFSKIARSTESKVNNLADIANLVYRKKLKTNNIKISGTTIEVLANIITGDDRRIAILYRSGKDLVVFFRNFGSLDSSLPQSLSRKDYTVEKLNEYNGTDIISDVIIESLPPPPYTLDSHINARKTLVAYLRKDGYYLIESGGGFSIKNANKENITIQTSNLEAVNHEFINEQISKAKEKLDKGDYDGAITNSRSLVEQLLKSIISKADLEIPECGDIMKLYKQAEKALKFDSVKKGINKTFQRILTGLANITQGLGEFSNKVSDRHAPLYKPSRRHAQLAINAAFTLCEFLLESLEYQQSS